MKYFFRLIHIPVIILLLITGTAHAQIVEEDVEPRTRKGTVSPNVINFEQLFKQDEVTREGFRELRNQQRTELEARLARPDALETAVDPESYIVGPGDIFTFNIWGAMENQLPLTVTPEGKLLVPSVGEIEVAGLSLVKVQTMILEKAQPYYENSEISLSLQSPRYFRVHVVGEVEFPGTYVGQATYRISDMIFEAGGPSEWAWLRKIELRHPDGRVDYFDQTEFEQMGHLETNRFVNGGDVIYVPPMQLGSDFVEVEGEMERAGTYQILPNETLFGFLQRIRAIERNMDLTKTVVIRTDSTRKGKNPHLLYIQPLKSLDQTDRDFLLQKGDRILIPSKYVYVKGAVRMPGAYPYALNLRAKDYAGMAGGDYRAASIKAVQIYHVRTGKFENGPDILVEAGDVVHLEQNWNERLRNVIQIIPVFTSLILAAKAAGFFGE